MSTNIVTPPSLQSVRGPFLWLSGGFAYGEAPVPFYAVTLRVEDAVNFIRLPNELPLSRDKPIEIEELFQRELNEERVRDELLKYLQAPSEPKFFNSLTVALLPMERVSSHLELAPAYSSVPRTNHPVIPGYEREDVGQISLYRSAGDPGHGYIAWEPEATHPVVLDGQHRLAALKLALSGPAFPGRADLANARISCLFLVLDERAGFHSGGDITVLSACRSVFIDLNKHARQVSRARQYLLDENDVAATALRSVLAPSVEADPSEGITSRVVRTSRLPLAVVGWRSETAKFDGNSPYLTSILALHGVIESVLSLRIPDSDDYEALGVYLQKLTSKLLDPDKASSTLDELNERLKSSSEREVPFVIPRSAVRLLADGFRAKYGPRLTRPLVELAPYRALVESFETSGYWTSKKEAWFSLEEASAKRLIAELEAADPSLDVADIAGSIKGQNLAFQVIFQRAILLSLHSLLTFPTEVWVKGFAREDAFSEEEFVTEFVARFDERLAPALAEGSGPDSAFVGAGLRAEGTVDFRKTRIAGNTGFMIHALLAPKVTGGDQADATLRDWLAKSWTRPARTDSAYAQLFWSHATAWRRSLSEILRAREETETEEALLDLGVRQLAKLGL